jgi:2-amino-4-hydroxy-6-hydroxymethyldihydropteridine diphosphokinase
MNEFHRAYLSLGSNISPQTHLVRAVRQLAKLGMIAKISNAWESESVGADGPNYLNACILFITPLAEVELKKQILYPTEAQLGRRRSDNKFAPRTMDIDIVIFNNRSCADKYWEQAFVVVPLAEIYPTFHNPLTQETLTETAARLRREIWMEARWEVLRPFSGINSGRQI